MANDNTDIIDRLARVEERVAVTIEKLAEFISDYSEKVEATLSKVIAIESVLHTEKIKKIDAIWTKVDILWESRQSVWRIFGPVLASLMSSGIGGFIVWAISKGLQHP